jgi:hypothetical protein
MTDQTNKETTMKKFAISLIALAAISTASFAEDRPHDLYSSGAGYAMQLNDNSTSNNAFVVAKKWTDAPTAYEISIMNAIEGERNNNDK